MVQRFGILLLLLCCGTSIAACVTADRSDRDRIAAWRTDRLAIGDTTVVRTTGASSAAAGLTLTRELSIGKSSGSDNEMFSVVSLITPAADGSILFFDSGRGTALHFDSTGKYMNSYGRAGDGPGEYVNPVRIVVADDRRVFIQGQGRYSMFSAEGKLILDRKLAFEDPALSGELAGITPDGYVHAIRVITDTRYPDSVTASGQKPIAVVVHRMSVDGQPIDTTFRPSPRAPNKRFEYRLPGSSQRGSRPVPFAFAFTATYSSLGYWITGGDDTTYAVTVHRRDAGPLRIVSDLPRVEATTDERAFELRSLTSFVRGIDPSAKPTLSIIPTRKPPFKDIITDAEGRLWVQLWRAAVREAVDSADVAHQPVRKIASVEDGVVSQKTGRGMAEVPRETERWVEPVVYDVFEPTGEFLGRVTMPPNATFGNARGKKLWLVVRDSLDLPTVVRYRFLN